MQFVSRSEWGARAPRSAPAKLNPDTLRGIALHYTGVQADEQVDHANCAARVRAAQDYHMEIKGWNDLAYNFLTCRHGFVFEGRGFGVRSAANGTTFANDTYYAVCFLGDDTAERDDVTRPGRLALVQILALILESHDFVEGPFLRPHGFFVATECPGNQLRTWLTAFGKAL